jgi:hypothetical protein
MCLVQQPLHLYPAVQDTVVSRSTNNSPLIKTRWNIKSKHLSDFSCRILILSTNLLSKKTGGNE